MDFELYPHVVSLSPPAPRSPLVNGHETTLGSFGFARAEKGSPLLQEAMVELLARKDEAGAKFVIQWGKDFPDGRGGFVRKAPELLNHSRVEFIDHALDTEHYQARLGQVDGLILPYQLGSYYNRVSRVAIEAACLGLPFIYPRNSWLQDLAERFGAGVGFEDGNRGDLVRAIREFSAQITRLRALAAERGAEARRYHSAVRFKACLFREPDALRAMSF
jgi:glycosyltransferase involved in cell wall biosynthesis